MSSSSISTTSNENLSVAERPVINASPLIFLSKAGLLSLLTLVGEEFVVPEAVATEI